MWCCKCNPGNVGSIPPGVTESSVFHSVKTRSGAPSPGIWWPGHEPDYSLAPNAKVKDGGAILPLYTTLLYLCIRGLAGLWLTFLGTVRFLLEGCMKSYMPCLKHFFVTGYITNASHHFRAVLKIWVIFIRDIHSIINCSIFMILNSGILLS